MSNERHIFVLGFNPHAPANEPGPWGPFAEVEKTVRADLDKLGRNGFPCTLQLIDGRDVDKSIAEFEAQLAAGQDKYAALMFGAGLRTYKDPVPFEKAIGVVRRVLRSHVPVLFNDGPDRHTWAIERHFGVSIAPS